MKINNLSFGLIIASKNYISEVILFQDESRIHISNANVEDKLDGIKTSVIIKFLKQINIIKEENDFLIYNDRENVNPIYKDNILKTLLTFLYKSQKKSFWVKAAYRGKAPVYEQLAGDGSMFSKTIIQSFQEAGLDNVQGNIDWWRDFQHFSQTLFDEEQDNISRSETGWIGEKLSMQYEEQKRNIKAPILKSIEDSSLGFDIQSQISDNDSDSLFIEVKTSKKGLEDAKAMITSNELKTAKRLDNYLFHFWDIYDPKKPKLAIIRKDKIKVINENIDTGVADIETLSVQFKNFETNFNIIDGLVE